MTVANQSIRADYTGSGSTGPFTFAFPLQNISDLLVITCDLNGHETVLTLTTDYTVVGIRAPLDYSQGGTLTLVNNLTSGWRLALIAGELGIQNTSIKNNSEYYASLHENQFDYRSVFDLQLFEKVSKSLRFPQTEPTQQCGSTLPSIANRANKTLGFDANGNVAMFTAVPAGSVAFTSTGLNVAQAATLTALLQILGIFVVANQAALAGLTPISGGFNFAYQQDLGNYWVYNTAQATWFQMGLALP